MNKQSWMTKLLSTVDRYKFVLLVAVLGAVLLLWPGGGEAETSGGTVSAITTSDPADLEQAMAEILEKMDGVGQVDVLLTLQSGEELILAQDSALRYSGDVQSPDDYERTSDVVTGAGSNGVVVTQTRYPEYRGALIVCDGGGSDAVRLKVVGAVSALTGLGTDRIAVVARAVSNP